MSDLIDVQNMLVSLVAAALYPSGTGAASVSGNPIVVYPGWPTASQLDADLLVNKAHVSIFPTDIETNKTRFSKDWVPQSLASATITATLVGQAITLAGAIPAPFTAHNVAAVINGQPYVYAVQPGDTLTSIATALAALIVVGVPGTVASGSVVTLPASANVTAARVGVTGTSSRELRRQERVFQITVWSSTPAQRDVIGAALDVALAGTEVITMPDGYGARLIYRNSRVTDDLQKAKLYRRDFRYSVEYATTQTETDTQITQEQLGIALQNDGATQYAAARVTNL
jgi:hypothetical protein